ncbi:MAG: AEC family transporter [Peptoniphilus sp.]|nr:AEC family transporter [Peptoniphilus sp.]
MNYLTVGIDIIFPVFFVLSVGYILKVSNFINENFLDQCTNLLFYIALPLNLFLSARDAQIENFDVKYAIFLVGGTILLYLSSWFFGRYFIKDKNKLTAFVHCAYRSNFVYIGIPILKYIDPNHSMEPVIIVMVFILTLYNLLAIILLTFYRDATFNIRSFLRQISKNPMIVSILLGLLAKWLNLHFYGGVESGMELISTLATPLSLIIVGASLNFTRDNSDWGLMFTSAFIKVVLAGAIATPIAYFLGFNSDQVLVAYVLFSCPCAINCFIMAKGMGSDYELTSKIVTTSFVMATFSYAIGIPFFKYLGFLQI